MAAAKSLSMISDPSSLSWKASRSHSQLETNQRTDGLVAIALTKTLHTTRRAMASSMTGSRRSPGADIIVMCRDLGKVGVKRIANGRRKDYLETLTGDASASVKGPRELASGSAV
ncbi:hypothetical protein HBI56_185790 [Parastagonospora nodorum]|uniref:Uncharacterized protein n=1 Tax=Phaeosphaeria nodorum (strain SN15 / ATCC MYA-4574 / FGSC 10173) TaxID=321614 RepID=A0A7U2IB00_PHANO|nr:hypothetical protein HBH56_163790 [Parastagonospora nodorum]QRD06521.1 hypothetical protein JI435_446010 [Parastagonospora nodorum SN15]KAH3931892.1 hypothetical protein HBH54_085450 [Parastagonospora nodorum]KAH3972676.1 hypothetical protein HBH51_099990 [Parastagonospora nodorum]KAH4020703.1 hypothetical protein HBI09_178850 [Parastagonospora nodorum]